jgi:hypothetical protein
VVALQRTRYHTIVVDGLAVEDLGQVHIDAERDGDEVREQQDVPGGKVCYSSQKWILMGTRRAKYFFALGKAYYTSAFKPTNVAF